MTTQQPLLDLGRLFVAIRRGRRLWLACALLGLIGGVLVAVLLPAPPTAVTRILVTHEQDQPSDTGSLIRTDAALVATTRIASAALTELGSGQRPEDFLEEYTVTGVTNNVLEISVEGATPTEALRRAEALAKAFIADHVGRSRSAAQAEAKALLNQRDQIQADLAATNAEITRLEARSENADEDAEEGTEEGAAQPDAAGLDTLYARRAELTSRVSDLSQQAEEAAIGAPRVADGTLIVDTPQPVPVPVVMAGATNGALGFVLGLVAGLALAVVTGVVRDKPVLRRDIAAHLGASVIAQLPSPRRGPSRLWRGRRATRERGRVAGTLVRLMRAGSWPVSVLELGAPRLASALTLDVAAAMATDRAVLVVTDPPGRVESRTPSVRVVGTNDPDPGRPDGVRIGLGSVTPGTAWTDLAHLGAETVLVVRAGFANTEWLHTVARQLADARIPIVGVVLVDPDPRDRTDGTLWDGLHTALRGRGRATAGVAATGTNGARPAVQPHLRKLTETKG
ncbi:Wzz/FepE/Etk N-terminal domain-containing protein [Actinophytocola sediminis]